MNIQLTDHALIRLRDHWPEARHFSTRYLTKTVRERIERALKEGKKATTPGGTYVPLSLEGRDGFAVLHDNRIVTFQPLEWCQEVFEYGDFF